VKSILVVDDEVSLVEFVGALLEDAGYTVERAYDGRSALDIARAKHPDLIIADIMMPVMDGLELYRQLRSSGATRHIPVIFITAGRVPEQIPPDVITVRKPFDLETLERAVAELLGGGPHNHRLDPSRLN